MPPWLTTAWEACSQPAALPWWLLGVAYLLTQLGTILSHVTVGDYILRREKSPHARMVLWFDRWHLYAAIGWAPVSLVLLALVDPGPFWWRRAALVVAGWLVWQGVKVRAGKAHWPVGLSTLAKWLGGIGRR